MRVSCFKTSFKQSSKSLLVLSIVLALLGSLSACGFHMRGSYHVPSYLKNICLSGGSAGPLTRALEKRFELSGVTLSQNLDSCSRLTIINDTLDRRTLSLFPNGQVAEYELIYTIEYEFDIHKKLTDQSSSRHYSFELFRDYKDNPDVALAKSREMKLILSELRSEAANRIVRQLASIQL